MSRGYHDYIAAIQFGSIRELTLDGGASPPNPQGATNAGASPSQTVVRQGGPIRHVFFILKENRTYDQILGDMSEGNGDPKLVYFGARVTPNQHALAQRFGLFDNFYASGEVSDAGHNWADGAFVNDYAERMWPPAYGNRNDNDQVLTGIGASVPAHGYMWDAARRAGVTFRDYGEMALMPAIDGHPASTAPSIGDRYDRITSAGISTTAISTATKNGNASSTGSSRATRFRSSSICGFRTITRPERAPEASRRRRTSRRTITRSG